MSYRKDEGRYARMFAFWALFLLIGYGCFHGSGLADIASGWMADSDMVLVDPFPLLGVLKISNACVVGLWLLIGLVLSTILNRPSIAEALIATENEMHKVTWPTWGETWQGTMAVGVMVVVLFGYLLVCDLGLGQLMQMLFRGGA